MPEQILETFLEEELKTSYLDYAMSVIVGRAIPDARDGLKPVQRRILYAMHDLGLLPNRPFRKSATVVGEVIGKYHPHGDGPVYDALVRMAQDFSMRYPLVQGQGNFGSIDGDPPAAYRYTEARLSPLALEMLEGLDEETVDFLPNFDGRLEEPVVLPGKFPNLLCNGTTGIAVGMATSIPPHNLGEVVDALLALIENPELTTDDLLGKTIKGPDFPTAGILYAGREFYEGYRTGRGRAVVEARAEFEETRKGYRIVVREIPYMVSKTTIIDRIVQLVKSKRIEGIADLRDESDREGIRLVIELKRGQDPERVWNLLLLHTPLRTSFSFILLVLVNGEPRTLSLKELLVQYLEHREEVVIRRTRYRLRKAEARAHLLEGFLRILEDLDRAIEIIRGSENRQEAHQRLKEAFGLSDDQTKAVLEMRLHQLTRMEQGEIREEYARLQEAIRSYHALLASHDLRMEEIRKELVELKEKYADPRRTEIRVGTDHLDFRPEDLIPDEEVVVTLTHRGYIKRTPLKSFRTQKKGGVGRLGIKLVDEDWPQLVETTRNHDHLLVLTHRGKAYHCRVYQLVEGAPASRGRPIRNVLRMDPDETVRAVIPFRDWEDGTALFFVTRKGYVKRTHLTAFVHAGRSGIIALNLEEDDHLVTVFPVREDQDVILATEQGQGIRFPVTEVRIMGRPARGVRGIRVLSGDGVVDAIPVLENHDLLVVTRYGYGKRTGMEEIRRIHRGGKGVRLQRITAKTGPVIRILPVQPVDEVLLLTERGISLRMAVARVPRISRVTQGVRLMRVKEEDRIVDVARIQANGEEG